MTGILRGSSVGGAKARTGLPKLVDSLMDSQESLITHKIGIDEINEGFGMMKRGEGIRTVANF
jgi:S-(hydroxymethyl)glutathione dehydrogenase/alcohol dehydrogenase